LQTGSSRNDRVDFTIVYDVHMYDDLFFLSEFKYIEEREMRFTIEVGEKLFQ
jgi:hypothetical protein